MFNPVLFELGGVLLAGGYLLGQHRWSVLVTLTGVVKLIDFGIAKPTSDEDSDLAGGSASIGSLSLTPGYAAPERMVSAAVTTAADIYSLGKLLAKLIPPGAGDREWCSLQCRASCAAERTRAATQMQESGCRAC